MDRFFPPEYVQGYTAALLDVLDYFESDLFRDDLKYHKRKQNLKTMAAFIRCMIDSRAILREEPDAFIRCNNDVPGGFELWFEGKKKEVDKNGRNEREN